MTLAIIVCTINSLAALWIATAAYQKTLRVERRATKQAKQTHMWANSTFQRKEQQTYRPRPHKTWNKEKGHFE